MTINGPEGLYIPDYVQGAKTDAAKEDAAYWRARAREGRRTVERVVDVTDPRKLMQLKEDMQQIAEFEKGVIEFQNGIIDGALKCVATTDRLARSLDSYGECVRLSSVAAFDLVRRADAVCEIADVALEGADEIGPEWETALPDAKTRDEKASEEWAAEINAGKCPTRLLRIARGMPAEAALAELAIAGFTCEEKKGAPAFA